MQLHRKEEAVVLQSYVLIEFIYRFLLIILHLITAEKIVTKNRVEKEECSELKGWTS